MQIYVDADACPTKAIIEKIGKEFSLPVTMIIDTSHILQSDYSEIITVSQAPDAVDLALINRCGKNDIVVTQDYGVAALALAKGSLAIHPKGTIYTNENIDRMLFERHISKKQRKSGRHSAGNAKKRTLQDDEFFEKQLRLLINPV
jgi:uncharacterized protein YaiI (UPF0178 family)